MNIFFKTMINASTIVSPVLTIKAAAIPVDVDFSPGNASQIDNSGQLSFDHRPPSLAPLLKTSFDFIARFTELLKAMYLALKAMYLTLKAISPLKATVLMGHFATIRSHFMGVFKRFQKILSVECLGGPQQMTTEFFRLNQSFYPIHLIFKNRLIILNPLTQFFAKKRNCKCHYNCLKDWSKPKCDVVIFSDLLGRWRCHSNYPFLTPVIRNQTSGYFSLQTLPFIIFLTQNLATRAHQTTEQGYDPPAT